MSTLSVNTVKSLNTNGPVFQNSSGTEKGRLAKAYANFDGTFGTSPFTLANGGIRQTFNITSITDVGEGRYKTNFDSSAFTSANYIVAGTSGNFEAVTSSQQGIVPMGVRTTSQYEFRTVTGSSGGSDKTEVNIVFFGD